MVEIQVGVLVTHAVLSSSFVVKKRSDWKKSLARVLQNVSEIPVINKKSHPRHVSESSLKITESSRNPFTWNARIKHYIEMNQELEAFLLYMSMVEQSVSPDEFTFPLVFKACSTLKRIREGKQIHAHVVKHGNVFASDVFVQNALLYMYGSCGFLDFARRVFDEMAARTLVSWNSMIAGYSKCTRLGLQAVSLYILMLTQGIEPDSFSFTVLLRACASVGAMEEGLQIHSHVIKLGFGFNTLILHSLIEMYVKFGLVEVAYTVYNRVTERTLVSSNILITGFMRKGNFASAEELFNKMDSRNVVSWNALISGNAQNGRYNEAFALFQRMQQEGIVPNSITIVSVLSACANAGALSLGKWVHWYIEKKGLIDFNEIVNTALINMYAKCGDIESAHQVFQTTAKKDIVCWDAMIEGFAMHGRGKEALELFHEMRNEGLKPDGITFTGVLNACKHAGLIDEGLKHFKIMSDSFGIKPDMQHFACVVDLLGRDGRVNEALQIIRKMPMPPDVVVWSALLNACKIHKNDVIAESVMKHIIDLAPKSSSSYVLLSNIYAAKNQWEDVIRIRRLIKYKGAEKDPGCSLVEIKGVVNEFVVGDSSHPQGKQIYQKLEELIKKIKMVGYVPKIDLVSHNIEDEGEKERALYFHSDKLAVAFGLVNTSPGTPIRIVNNIRICKDCHTAMKFITQIERRKIVVRDRNRFHHFKDGQCSCGDYW